MKSLSCSFWSLRRPFLHLAALSFARVVRQLIHFLKVDWMPKRNRKREKRREVRREPSGSSNANTRLKDEPGL